MVKHFFLSFFLFFLLTEGNGQDTVLPLKMVLEQLEQQHNITISHDVDIASRLMVSTAPANDLQAQFDYLKAQTGLSFSEAGSGIFLMKVVAHAFCIRVLDDSGNPLDFAQIILNNKATNFTTDIEGYARFELKLTFQDTIKSVISGLMKSGLSPKIWLVKIVLQ